MAAYRFRVTFEDHEDIYRDIEIKSNQTFEDLHNIIQQSIGFDGSQLASFYLSDDNWHKGQEVTLLNMSEEEEHKITVMRDAKLKDFISDPHQKIYYVFDFMNMWNFYVELMKIIPSEETGVEFPRVIKSIGDAPKQYGSSVLKDSDEDLDFEEEPLMVDDDLSADGIDGEEDGMDEMDAADDEPSSDEMEEL